MTTCTEIRDLFGAVLDHEASQTEAERVRVHVAGCPECAELFEAMAMVTDAGRIMAEVEPPPHISAEIAASPCRRWLGLLYQAVPAFERWFGRRPEVDRATRAAALR